MTSRRPDTLYLPHLEKNGKVRKWRNKLKFWKGDTSIRQKASYDDSSYIISISAASSARSQSTSASKPPLPPSVTSSSPSSKSVTLLKKSFAVDENSILQTSESSLASSQIPCLNRTPNASIASVESMTSKFSSELSAVLAAAADTFDGISLAQGSLEDPCTNVASVADRSVESLSTGAQHAQQVEIDCTNADLYFVDHTYTPDDHKREKTFSREASTEKQLRFVLPNHKETEETSFSSCSRVQSEDLSVNEEDLLSNEDTNFTEDILDKLTCYFSCLPAMQEMEKKLAEDVCTVDEASETSDETWAFSPESDDSISTHAGDDSTTLSDQYEIIEDGTSHEIRSYSSRSSSSERRTNNFWQKYVSRSDGYESSDVSDGLLHSDGSHIYMTMTDRRQKKKNRMNVSNSGASEEPIKKSLLFHNSVSAFDDLTDISKQSTNHDGIDCENKKEVSNDDPSSSQGKVFEHICEKASCSLGCSTSDKTVANDTLLNNSMHEKWLDLVKSEILKSDYEFNARDRDRSTGTRQTLPGCLKGQENPGKIRKKRDLVASLQDPIYGFMPS